MSSARQAGAPVLAHEPRTLAAGEQGLYPGRYGRVVRLLSMAAFTLAFVGWLNETWLFLLDTPVWLSRYTEYAVIAGFGLWRIRAERDPYTRRRLAILVAAVTAFWWLVPWLAPMYEPYVGYLWNPPVFPSLHVPGTVTFFLVLGLVLLFGRRVICGFNCPCVGIRETVGFPFRARTLRGPWAWRLRHTKWLFFVYYVGVMVATLFPPTGWTVGFVGGFYLLVAITYFGTFFVAPLTGNRFYCRYLCPYGATFGLLNHAGFYGIRMDPERCVDCRRCERVCDMGIPVWAQGRAHGRVTGIEDCMGCARCVVACPTDALEIRDVRNLLRPALRQDGSHLRAKVAARTRGRSEAEARRGERREAAGSRTPGETGARERDARAPAARDGRRRAPGTGLASRADRPRAPVSGGTGEAAAPPEVEGGLGWIRREAARCLDCGVPGCRNACPLGNRIPDWLQAAARGELEAAAAILDATSPMPEVCGRLCPQERLCEGACARARLDRPVAIGRLEVAVTEAALAAGWRPRGPRRRRGREWHVSVVGAGPAGLACAERLARAGVAVTVLEAASGPGGLLASVVPPFKLDRQVLMRRIGLLEALGVRFETGAAVDEAGLRSLLRERDAVFLGIGAQRPRRVALPGRALEGVVEALPFLEAAAAGAAGRLAGRRVLVLGGGDTAMDCARTAVRLGAAAVTVAYRGPAQRLRARPKEVAAARAEGVALLLEHAPEAIEGEARVSCVRFRAPTGPVTVPADVVVPAFGFEPAAPAWLAAVGVALEDDGRIRVDGQGRTTHPRIYAGGDVAHGPDLVVTAVAAGRRAAEAMLGDLSLWGRLRHRAGRLRSLAASGEAVA